MNEINKSQEETERRKQLTREQGFWICERCGTKYYAGINCDPCMYKDFSNEIINIRKTTP